MHATLPLLVDTDFPPLERHRLETLQVNLGYVCNQSCVHCHVNAGPARTESMTEATARQVIEFLAASGAGTLDSRFPSTVAVQSGSHWSRSSNSPGAEVATRNEHSLKS